LLELPSDQDPRLHPRNLCIHEGYASLALVPIRDRERIVGLIHINDRRKGCFTRERIELLEGIASHIGEALVRKQAEKELEDNAVRLTILAEERERHLAKLAESLSSIIKLVSQVVETRDPYTAGHQRRVAQLAVRISEDMGLPDDQIEDIRVAALLHDVGKMAIPAEILSKPGVLSPIEFELIKGHSEAGYQILTSASMEAPVAEIVYQHHERFDGSGYPRGLTADDLLPEARVLMVADVVEAMTSHRPYRPGLGIESALGEIEQGEGRLYDPDVVESCLRVFREQRFAFSET
jgi:putative nucleotidyltransferase with HDIG domain